MFELIDRVVSMDIAQRGMQHLYDAARELSGEPLCSAAARHLMRLARGDHAMLLTGSIVRGWVSLDIGETDGPIGTAALARMLSYGLNVVPVVLTDPSLVKGVTATLEAAGLNVVDAHQARAAVASDRFTCVAVVDTCSTGEEARAEAKALHERYDPRVVVSTERAGMTADGTFRNSSAVDYSAGRARLDHVVHEAKARGVPTIGIGDFGNEIGMGAIRAAVERHMPKGSIICADLATDVVFPVGVSNWGCYAIQAAMAIMARRADLAHSAERERSLLLAAGRIGLIDGLTGRREPTADGLSLEANASIVALLEAIVRRAL